MYRTVKQGRTRLYTWLPPEGEAGARIQGSQKVSKNFLGRGAAGATGKAASAARRQPWRLAGDEMRGYYPCIGKEWNKVKSTLIHRKRSPFPLKKGEGMKREGVVTDTHRARPVRLCGKNRVPENRSEARFLGRGGAALQVERFAKWQNADSIGERRRAQGDRGRMPYPCLSF